MGEVGGALVSGLARVARPKQTRVRLLTCILLIGAGANYGATKLVNNKALGETEVLAVRTTPLPDPCWTSSCLG